jgi:hypothetical protein
VDEMLARSFVHTEDWKHLPGPTQERILASADRKQVLAALVEHRLLTEYQATRIAAGTTFGLVLGNYRILDRLGAGGMAVVFKAEHVEMRHTVAVKVLPLSIGQDQRLQSRFTNEMRIVARLRPPVPLAGLQRRGLPGRVGAEHGGDGAAVDRQVETVDGDHVAVRHAESPDRHSG